MSFMSLKGGGSNASQGNTIQSMQVSTAEYGSVIPLVYGRARMGTHMIYETDFVATPVKNSAAGKSLGGSVPGSTQFTYTDTEVFLLCHGPITAVGRTWVMGQNGLIRRTAALVNSLWSKVALGALGQAPWSYLTSNHPGADLGYSGIAYIAKSLRQLGTSPTVPQQTFEVFGLLPFSATIKDANPAAVLPDMIQNAVYGMAPNVAIGSLTNFSNWCVANSFFISPIFDNQRQGQEWLRLILDCTFADAYWSEGQLWITPYGTGAVTGNGVTFTPNLTPVVPTFTDEDYIRPKGQMPVTITTADPATLMNQVGVQFTNAYNDYNVETINVRDDANELTQQRRTAEPLSYQPIPSPAMATAIAQMKLQRGLYVPSQYSFKTLSAKAALLDPMDIIAITDSVLRVTALPLRVVSIDYGNYKDKFAINITAEDIGPDTTPGYQNTNPANPATPSDSPIPSSINAPVFMELPYVNAAADPSGGYQLWIALSGQNANLDWGGADAYISTDNVNFTKLSQQAVAATMGVLTGTLPNVSGFDTTSTLALDLTASAGAINSITDAQGAAGYNLAWIEGELVCFCTVAAGAGPFLYNVTRIYRGLYGTSPASHSATARFVYLGSVKFPDPGLLTIDYPPDEVGTLLYFQFTSFNHEHSNEEALGAVTVYSYTPAGPASGTANPTHALPWAASTAATAGVTYVTFGGFAYLALTSGTTGGSAPPFSKQLSATVNDNGVLWQNVGRSLNVIKGSIVGVSIGVLANPLVLGGNPPWAATTAYPLGSIVFDSNNNGEQAITGVDTDSIGSVTPSIWIGHYPYLTNGATTAAVGTVSGSATHWDTISLSAPPITAGVVPQIQGVADISPSGTVTSVAVPVPSGVASGDVLLAMIVTNTNKTLTPPAGWSLIDTVVNSTFVQIGLYVRNSPGSEPASYTWSWTGATAASASMLRVTGAKAYATNWVFTDNTGSSTTLTAPTLTTGIASALQILFLAWGSAGVITPPPSNSGSSPPTWSGTEGVILQDAFVQWEQIGPLFNYGQWVTVATATLNIQSATDAVRLTLTGLNSASNMGVNDKVWVQFLDGATVIASGRATVSSTTTGTTSASSGEASPVLLRKTATGLSGLKTITAQVRVTNGSGNGIFNFSLDTADFAMEDQIK